MTDRTGNTWWQATGAAAVLFALSATAIQAQTNVYARTYVGSYNNNFTVSSSSQVDGGTFGFADVTSDGGFALAAGQSAPGALAGSARVAINTPSGNLSGSLRALAQGNSTEAITIGNNYCIALTCVSATGLGIARIDFTLRIHASGGVGGFATANGPGQINFGFASIDYNWGFAGASGGGRKSYSGESGISGASASQMAIVSVAPGSVQSLMLGFTTDADAGTILGPGWMRQGTSSASGFADFASTLRWDGIQSARAFDASGNEILLAPGGRFTLIGASGFDFWDAAPGFNAVPEPASWALLIGGFGLVGAAARRQRQTIQPRPNPARETRVA